MNFKEIINNFSEDILKLKKEILSLQDIISDKNDKITSLKNEIEKISIVNKQLNKNIRAKHGELVKLKREYKTKSDKLLKYEIDEKNLEVKKNIDKIIEDYVSTCNKDIDISCLQEQYIRRFNKKLIYKRKKLKSFLQELGYDLYKKSNNSFIKWFDDDDNSSISTEIEIDFNFSYIERLKNTFFYKKLFIMGNQGKSKEEWKQYFSELKKESEIIERVRETNSIKLGFIAEYLFPKLFIHGRDKHLFIGYLNNILKRDKILEKKEFILDFQSLNVLQNQSSMDIKLNLILNNGKNFYFPIEMKSITNNEGSIRLSGPYYSYYLIVNLLSDDFSTKLDSFYLASPMYIIEKCFDTIKYSKKKLSQNELDKIWMKRIRKIETNNSIAEIKLPISNEYFFLKEDANLPFSDDKE